MSRKNPRFRYCKVKTILPADCVKDIMVSSALNHKFTRQSIEDCFLDIRKNVDDNTALLQDDLVTSTNRLESLIEKVLYISCISILLNVITLCIC